MDNRVYGNAKIHKSVSNPPLRHIVAQMSTPMYHIAKKIDKIIQPYMPNKYSLKSTDEFIELINTQNNPSGLMASLDVESLYSSVPIDATIDIILNNVYNHPTMAKPVMPRHILKAFLNICTKKAPFKHIDGTIYQQTEGLAMGGPLSCTMANFYMSHIENEVLENVDLRPALYGRFIDDIFILVRNENHLISLKQAFIDASVLNLTHEININNKLPFLDVLLEMKNGKFVRTVYTKPTKSMDCINFECDAPDRYKTGVLYTLLNRAKKICNTAEGFYNEVERIKRLLINNGFPNCIIDRISSKYVFQEPISTATSYMLNLEPSAREHRLNHMDSPLSNATSGNTHQSVIGISDARTEDDNRRLVTIFYKNQYHKGYKRDEEAIRKILKRHVCQVNVKIKICIYYKSKKVCNVVMKNNLSNTLLSDNLRSHVVYEFVCPVGVCSSSKTSYIGMTNCTLSERMSGHRYKGAIFDHFRRVHNTQPTVDELVNSSKIIYFCDNRKNLLIFEALLIKNINLV